MKNKEILELLKPVAEVFNVAVKELWGIFVKRYLVKGISEVFTSLVISIPCIYFFNDVGSMVKIPLVLGLLVSVVFVYDAISLIFNPQYFALNEIIDQVKNNKENSWR